MPNNNIFDSLKLNPDNLKPTKDKAEQIQNQMAAVQKALAAIETEGTAGAGNYKVRVCLNGQHEAIKVTIDPQLLSEPIQVLCDLIASAITDASHKTEIAIQTKMMELFKGLT